MGKGTIVSGGDSGLYSVKLLHDRTKANQALDRINRWITAKEEKIASIPSGDPDKKLPGLKLSLSSLLKQKEYLLSIPEDETISAWCADYSEQLIGDVGTIEIDGEKNNVLIRPGYTDSAAHIPSRDGQLQNIMAMTPEQAFYNMAMAPGWKKWMPTYRIGTITSIAGDICSVNIDAAVSQIVNAGSKSINESNTLSNVDIVYMDCNGAAFQEGDRVVVQFYGQDFDAPKVIGFEKEPKECDRNLLLVWVSAFDEYDSGLEMGYNFYRDSIWRDFKYNALNGSGFTQLNLPMAFFFWDMDKDDYAGEEHKIYWTNPRDTTGIKHYLKAEDYPFANPVPQTENDILMGYWSDILAKWKSRTYQVTTPIYTFSFEGEPYPEVYPIAMGETESDDGYYQRNQSFEIVEGQSYPIKYDGIESQTLHGKYIGQNENDDFIVSGQSNHITGYVRDIDHIWFYDTGELFGVIQTYNGGSLVDANINSLSPVDYSWKRIKNREYEIQDLGNDFFIAVTTGYNYEHSGDFIKTWGNDTWCSSSHAVQVNTYRGYERNTFCQCEERDPVTGEWDTASRSTKLESACKALLNLGISMDSKFSDSTSAQFRSIKITAAYYKGQTVQLGMLEELDDRRDPATDLIESMWCKQTAQALVDSWIENAELMHGDVSEFGERVGGENIAILSTDKTIAEVVNGWMESPHHRDLIMNLDLKYAGYASGIYPESVTQITLGPGQYDPITGGYTTENTIMEIPEAYRGKMRAYCLRMTQYLDENE